MKGLVDPDNLPVGEQVDGWRVVRRLGGGAYGAVYQVEKGGAFFALKLALLREQDPDARHTDKRAERELSCLLALRHPHIARVWGHGRWPHPKKGFFYLVMDYVEGFTLEAWQEQTRPTAHEALVLLDKVFSAVEHMHQQGIFHRDLKPANILVSAQGGEPMVVDYGVAHYPLPAVPRLTDTRLPPGTPRYTSPEALSFEAEHRHDKAARYEFTVADELYALGVILYDMLTNPWPVSRSQPQPLRGFMLPVPAHELNERVPEPLGLLAARLMEEDPAKRPVSVTVARRNGAELLPLTAEEWMKRPLHPLLLTGSAQKVAPAPVLLPEPVQAEAVAAPKEQVSGGAVEPARAQVASAEAPPPHGTTGSKPSHSGSWARTLAGGAVALSLLLACGAYLALREAAPERPEPSAPEAAAAPPLPSAPPSAEEMQSVAPPEPSPLASQPQSSPLQPGSPPEKGTPVNTRQVPEETHSSVCEQKQPPPQGSPAWHAWCKCAGIVASLAAMQAGCTAAQVRQSPTAECRQESVAAMQLLEVEFRTRAIEVDFDVDQPCAEGKTPDECCGQNRSACLPLGPITSRVKVGSGKLVPGTLLAGQVWRNPQAQTHRVTVRWTEATLPNGGKHPVCIEAGDGASRLCPNGDYVACRQQYADIVKRWSRPITP